MLLIVVLCGVGLTSADLSEASAACRLRLPAGGGNTLRCEGGGVEVAEISSGDRAVDDWAC